MSTITSVSLDIHRVPLVDWDKKSDESNLAYYQHWTGTGPRVYVSDASVLYEDWRYEKSTFVSRNLCVRLEKHKDFHHNILGTLKYIFLEMDIIHGLIITGYIRSDHEYFMNKFVLTPKGDFWLEEHWYSSYTGVMTFGNSIRYQQQYENYISNIF